MLDWSVRYEKDKVMITAVLDGLELYFNPYSGKIEDAAGNRHLGYTDKRQNDKRRKRQTSERQTSERTNVRSDKGQKRQTSERQRRKNVRKKRQKTSENHNIIYTIKTVTHAAPNPVIFHTAISNFLVLRVRAE